MLLIREKATHTIVLAFPDTEELTLTSTGLTADGLVVTDVNSTTHEVISAEPPVLPMRFVAGALTYDGSWAIFDQDLYDKCLPAATARDDEEARKAAKARNAAIIPSIGLLEETITARRIREAVLGTDSGWLANVDVQIAALRKQLT